MKPNMVNLALAQAQIETVRKEMWEVQLQEYPDSVPMKDGEIYDLMYTGNPPYLETTMKVWELRNSGVYGETEIAYEADKEQLRRRLEFRREIATKVAGCLMQDPCGFFYKCGAKGDGSYRFMGYRYGMEPEQYMSGFSVWEA